MKTKTTMHPPTLLLTLALALAGAGACGEQPSQEETSGGETTDISQEEASAADEVETVQAALASAPSCIAMRNGTIKRTKLPGQWTGIIDNACNSSVSINLDIGCGNKDPGCRTYAAKTSYYVKWWAGLATSCFRKVYECS